MAVEKYFRRIKSKPLQNLIPTLQVAVGPVILISGVGLLLLSMTNRLGRTIDRSRQLTEAYRSGTEADRVRLKGQLEILWQRACLIRASIVWAASAVLLVAVLMILLFISTLLGLEIASIIAILFGCCMGAVIVSMIYFIRDINLSLHALQLEINFEQKK
jgi:xanthine/uracil permease